MLDLILKNKIVAGGIAIFVIVGAWYAISGSSGSTELLVTEDYTTSGSAADRDLVATLLQLRAVSLEGALFSDPAFHSLQDFGSQIIPEPIGRPNPFEPLFFGPPQFVGPTQTTEEPVEPAEKTSPTP